MIFASNFGNSYFIPRSHVQQLTKAEKRTKRPKEKLVSSDAIALHDRPFDLYTSSKLAEKCHRLLRTHTRVRVAVSVFFVLFHKTELFRAVYLATEYINNASSQSKLNSTDCTSIKHFL